MAQNARSGEERGGGSMNVEEGTGQDEKQVLARLLGIGGGAPVATPEMLSIGLQWLLAMVKHELEKHPAADVQQWMAPKEIIEHFGISRERVFSYLRRLKAEGKVRMIRPTGAAGEKGHTRYNVADLEAAWKVEEVSHGGGKK